VIPEEALVATREGSMLFVVEDGVAHGRRVRVGLRTPGVAQIVEGLAVGEVVVRTGQMSITSGDAVRTAPADAGEPNPTPSDSDAEPATARDGERGGS
jgi:membrane fusion protein (multidrug efflux system)